MNNKEFDDIFKSSLSNLEATPSEQVWTSIEARLTRKKRRVIPLWWFSGAAAVIIFGLIYRFNFTQDTKTLIPDSQIEITKSPVKKKEEDIQIPEFSDPEIKEQSFIVKESKKRRLLKTKPHNLKTQISEHRVMAIGLKLPMSRDIKQLYIKQDAASLTFRDIRVTNKVDIFSILTNNSEVDRKDEYRSKWYIAPLLAVLASNSFTQGSPISDNLSNNTEGSNTLAYGIQVGYQVNDKWSIQSGIHIQNMSYNNSNIAVLRAIDNQPNTVSFNNFTATLVSNDRLERATILGTSITNIISFNANLEQNYSYLEFPVEVKYKVLQSQKFSSHLITGFSSLILGRNELILTDSNQRMNGAAQNINSFNVSGNIGVDVNYQLDKNWSLQFNPMLKVQLNTFDNTPEFAPYNFGVYSGIRYQF